MLTNQQKKGEGSHGGADAEHCEADAPTEDAARAKQIERDAKDYRCQGSSGKANARIDGHHCAPIALIRMRDQSRSEGRADAGDKDAVKQ